MAERWFNRKAEKLCSQLRLSGANGASSDLHVAKNVNVAVIGIQISQYGGGHDLIYVLRATPEEGRIRKTSWKEVLKKDWPSGRGRIFPTGISDDGNFFTYSLKDEEGRRSQHKKKIKA